MIFSSITFLYYFLPILLIFYFLCPNKYRNYVLLVFSLIFYFYGETKYIFLLLMSCFVNFCAGLLIEKYRNYDKWILIGSLICNIGCLMYFKYTNFFISNINALFHTNIALMQIVLPLGISFFTFQTLSYVVDVYNRDVEASHNFFYFATYVSFFPQLVAGPIVRYKTIEKELKDRKESYDDFAKGVGRFTIGLAKKVLIANVLGELCNSLTEMTVATVLGSMVNALSFTLQIYFDFSGYSDMAIGLGLMFGFHFLENFNYPLMASSITDFWRRWHISLSSFFRDYVYIPLGGNRVSKIKWIRNIFIVWFLTGFWHGAAWNFILWGLYFAVLLLFEKVFFGKYLERTKLFKHVYTIFFVIISFVIFNANSLSEIIITLKNMFFLNGLAWINKETMYYVRNYLVVLVVAMIASTPLLKRCIERLKASKGWRVLEIAEPIYYLLLLLIVTAYLIDSSFNPFLYFRF